ncbi:MAG: hypothetical protein U0169_09935 [Polyangiaceae bacterium]
MSVAAVRPQSPPLPARGRGVVHVPAERTSVSRDALRDAIRDAMAASGSQASAAIVETLTAHAAHETGDGSRMFNFNFGGIKGVSPEGLTADTRTREVVDGRSVEVRSGFRAYSSLARGAEDYVATMQTQFRSALGPASIGDLRGFAHALKEARYYTASEEDYARALERASGAPTAHGSGASRASVPGLSSPDSVTWAAVLDALSLPTARLAAPDDSEETT